MSVALPVVLFAGLTVVSELVSPAKGQSLLPTLPSITTTTLPAGGSVETYFDPGTPGVNQFHIIFSGPVGAVASTHPHVTASEDGGPGLYLRQLRVSTGHFSDIVVLSPGHWVFDVTSPFGHRTLSFAIHLSLR